VAIDRFIIKGWEERFSVSGTNSEIRILNERLSDTIVVSPVAAEMIRTALVYGVHSMAF
jgi:hypothetical protein